jgi:flagellar biosynthesis protein FliR
MAFGENDLLTIFLVFARIGTASMLMPGFALARAPMLFRVLLALALSAAIYPLQRTQGIVWPNGAAFIATLMSELVIGLLIGFLCAMFIYALRFATHFIVSMVGLAGIPGQPIDDAEANPPLVMLVSMSLTALIFASDLHLVSLRALASSYDLYPPGQLPNPATVMDAIAILLRDTSLLALQVASPFILYSLAINFALGLIGKLTPQLQAYFALMGLSTLLALVVLAIVGAPLLNVFASAYAAWLEQGL